MPKMQKELEEKGGIGRLKPIGKFLERQEEEQKIEDYDE